MIISSRPQQADRRIVAEQRLLPGGICPCGLQPGQTPIKMQASLLYPRPEVVAEGELATRFCNGVQMVNPIRTNNQKVPRTMGTQTQGGMKALRPVPRQGYRRDATRLLRE
jgi:hypothetical protein